MKVLSLGAFAGLGFWAFSFLLAPVAGAQAPLSLSGVWEIRPDKENKGLREGWFRPGTGGAWRHALVPSAWETALGIDFDGVGWYRKGFRVPGNLAGRRVFLRFQGAATEARVWVNGKEVGGHEGAWTPWEVEITSALRQGGLQVVVVRLDEKVGSNTQGFLPVVEPHFGGLWQGVEVLFRKEAWIEKDRLFLDATGKNGKGQWVLSARLPLGGNPPAGSRVEFSLLRKLQAEAGRGVVPVKGKVLDWTWEGEARPWTPGIPGRRTSFTLRAVLKGPSGEVLDRLERRVGFRRVETKGARLLLNGKPFVVRGILNWGYYPPLLAPAPDPDLFRKELGTLRAMGFNLVKFCLWEPPSYILDITDEEGMAAWVEYPTWHPRIDKAHREELLRDYTAMSNLDGNHPSVILRSVTCETGPSADLSVLKELYTLLKKRCPGTLVEDDSSWIGWNRVHDFWDDHTYWNDATWREKLRSLDAYRRERKMLPLVLGEAIASDTWADTRTLLPSFTGGVPFWAPKCLESQLALERNLQERFAVPGFDPVRDLLKTSLEYSLATRRFQVEAYRQELPWAGYVISVIRDIPACRMGIFDARGRPKWNVGDWSWHSPLSLSPRTPGDQRGFPAGPGGGLKVAPCLRVDPSGLAEGPFRIVIHGPGLELERKWSRGKEILPGWEGKESVFPYGKDIERPLRVAWSGDVYRKDGVLAFHAPWYFWAIPAPSPCPEGAILYGGKKGDGLETLFPGISRLRQGISIPRGAALVVTPVLDGRVLDYLEGGGRVLHLTSELRGSFKVEGLWFLRGTPWAPPRPKAFFERVPREMLSYLQAFELQGKGVIRGERLWGEVDPLLAFFETHDLDRVRPDLLLFYTGVGKGRLVVSCLRHLGGREKNYAGLWLARELARLLVGGPPPERALSRETVSALRSASTGEILKVQGPWLFRKDPAGKGLERGWQGRGADLRGWIRLAARSALEGKIWAAYDGWGWYRKEMGIPSSWKGKRVRLVFDSVDDMYELYVNGKKAGGYGKLDRSESSYLKRTWVDVTPFLEPGRENLFVVRVYDWVGAGGLNGEVWLTTGPVGKGLDLLRR